MTADDAVAVRTARDMTVGVDAPRIDDAPRVDPDRIQRRLRWVVVGGSLLLTLLAWSVSTRALEQRNRQRFDRQAERAITQFVEQLQRHADMLTAAAGLVMASERVTEEEWQHFTATLRLETQFPALSGIGMAQRVPAAELPAFLARQRETRPGFALHPLAARAEHLPVVHVSPASHAAAVVGFDLAQESDRRDAVRRAAELGTAQLTAPLRPTASGTPGVVMAVPFYRGGPDVPPDERGARFAGAVVASMLFESLAGGTLDVAGRQVRLRISDGAKSIYDETARADADVDPAPLLADTHRIAVFGREWRFDVQSTLGFRREAGQRQPWFVLVGGLCLDTLLLVLFVSQAQSQRRLQHAARALDEERAALARSNEKLAAFACVASHDLKAPLSGIRGLVDFIEEDLADYLARPDAAPDVAKNLARVRRQAARADALIEGILEYSGLGSGDQTPERVDTRELLGEIGETLDIDPAQLVLVGELPVLETCATRLAQVLANLVGNAFKYHHDAARARVRVAVKDVGDVYRFSVSDDGPGIDARLHELIFEPFRTAHAEQRDDSTGIGLAIVRKNVEAVGGRIRVRSAPGHGATFVFDWPKRIDAAPAARPGEVAGADGSSVEAAPMPRRAA